ncbi:unnamed protein product [Aphanomyces euteiches]
MYIGYDASIMKHKKWILKGHVLLHFDTWMLLLLLLHVAAATRIAMYNRPDIVDVHPLDQHIPLNGQAYRPPPPLAYANASIFLGVASFRDGERCGYTLFSAFEQAAYPRRLQVGVVDQKLPGDKACLDVYCALALGKWPGDECRYKDQIRINEQDANASRGPNVARHFQQALVEDETFCLQVDAHSMFIQDWDVRLLHEWTKANNEMAVLTTSLHTPQPEFEEPMQHPHLCTTTRGDDGAVRIEGASMLLEATTPQLSALYGAGFAFSKCHAETRVRIDPKTLWMVDGGDFLRAAHLWTHGYDFYSPSITVAYHNSSTPPPLRFESSVQVDISTRDTEHLLGVNRYKASLGLPVVGPLDATNLDLYAFGTARLFPDYLAFAGIDLSTNHDSHSCRQLIWQPYVDQAAVEALLPGWKMANPVHMPKEMSAIHHGQLRVVHSRMKGVPYQIHAMITMAAMLSGLVVFVVKMSWRRRRRQLTKFIER